MNQRTIASTVFRGIRLSVAGALLALLAGLLAVTRTARALPYVVTNNSDSGLGSLRQAITDANNNPGPDTITFAATTDGNPIVLAGAAGEDVNASGDLDILDGGDLTILGNGAANSIIDSGGIDRVFHICPNRGCANRVTFIEATIRNDSDAAGSGGGIRNEAGSTTLVGSTVSANTSMHGGGIWNNGTLNITNSSTIGGTGAGNRAAWGTGIFNEIGGTLVNGSTVSANTATYKGGGIYIKAGDTTVDGSTVSANTVTTNDGGGIYNFVGTLNVQNGSIIEGFGMGNTADNGDGGGIYNEYGTTMVTGSRIQDNTATINSGGVYNNSSIAGATSVTDSCIYGNSVTSYFNNQPAQQITTGNWWGAATGPNTPGADTVGGNVDVSGHLTAPILGCNMYLYLPVVLK